MTIKTKSNQRAESLPNNNRRKAIAGIAATGAAITLWHKPVIESVVLPAHAQTSTTDLDFFATLADASVSTDMSKVIFNNLVPNAYARQGSNEEPIDELVFEAEAINQGAGTFKFKIAAEKIPVAGLQGQVARVFLFGWEGTISGLNTVGALSPHGCAQAETAQITSINGNSLTLAMSYFSQNINLQLVDGMADLPSFPFSCTSNV